MKAWNKGTKGVMKAWNKGLRGRKASLETRLKQSKALKGRSWEDIYGEEGAKKRRTNYLKKIDEPKIIELFLNQKLPRQEIKKILGTSLKNINVVLQKNNIKGFPRFPLTEEHKKNISKGCKGKNIGKVCSEETKEKIRKNTILQHLQGKFPQTNTKIEKTIKNILDKNNIKYVHPFDFFNTYCCDFAFPDKKIVIECDGDYWHNYPNGTPRDRRKNGFIKSKGWSIFRFWENDIKNNLEEVETQIIKVLRG